MHGDRTTMSMSYHDFVRAAGGDPSISARARGSGSPEGDPNTIYYFETSTRHLHDISVSGPYFPLDEIVPQVLHNFGDACSQGSCQPTIHPRSAATIANISELGREAFLDAFLQDDHVAVFDRITSPINNNPNQTKTIRLIREHNPAMAASLPGPAWVVLQTEVLLNADTAGILTGPRTTPPPVKSLVPKGTFANQGLANARAHEVVSELAAGIRGARVLDRSYMRPGFLVLHVVNHGSGDPSVAFDVTAILQ